MSLEQSSYTLKCLQLERLFIESNLIYKSYQFEGGGQNLHRSLQPVAFKGEARTRLVLRHQEEWDLDVPENALQVLRVQDRHILGVTAYSDRKLAVPGSCAAACSHPTMIIMMLMTMIIDGGGDGGGADGDLGAWWSSKSENLPIILHCQAHV